MWLLTMDNIEGIEMFPEKYSKSSTIQVAKEITITNKVSYIMPQGHIVYKCISSYVSTRR